MVDQGPDHDENAVAVLIVDFRPACLFLMALNFGSLRPPLAPLLDEAQLTANPALRLIGRTGFDCDVKRPLELRSLVLLKADLLRHFSSLSPPSLAHTAEICAAASFPHHITQAPKTNSRVRQDGKTKPTAFIDSTPRVRSTSDIPRVAWYSMTQHTVFTIDPFEDRRLLQTKKLGPPPTTWTCEVY